MKQYIELEQAMDLERSQVNTDKLDQNNQVNESAPFDETNAASEEMMKQTPKDLIESTSKIYGSPPTQSGSTMQQFCIAAAPNDPDPRKTRDVLENAGLKPGCQEYAAVRARAAEVAANYPVAPSPDATSARESETASDLEPDTDAIGSSTCIEIDNDAEVPSLDTILQSFRSGARQGLRAGQRRVKTNIRKRKTSSSSDEKVLKYSRRSSGTSMDVNAEPRTASEERNACLCNEVFEEASKCSMHGVGGWS